MKSRMGRLTKLVVDQRKCRAGCNAIETATHIIQNCFRTHGGRVKRHDNVSKVLAKSLRQKGWNVEERNEFRTSEDLRKPDLVCQKENTVWVIDSQAVGHYKPLNELHKDKNSYYNQNSYYEWKECLK